MVPGGAPNCVGMTEHLLHRNWVNNCAHLAWRELNVGYSRPLRDSVQRAPGVHA